MNDFNPLGEITRVRTMDIREDIPLHNEIKEAKPERPLHRGVAILLIIALAICLIYAFLDPITKLNLKLRIFDNYTIEVVGTYYVECETEYIYVDGNLMQVGSDYYEFDGGRLYKYSRNYNGEWERVLNEDSDDLLEDHEVGSVLLDKGNYERVKGRLSTWALKEEANRKIDDLFDITVGRDAGKLAIIGYNRYSVRISMRFIKFGRTKIDPPWEE